MAKLIIMRGLPGSGKTSRAEDMLKKLPNSVRVSKDDLRIMMHSEIPWDERREKFVVQMHQLMIEEFLKQDKTVIVDDLNLNPKHLFRYSKIAKCYNCESELVNINTPLLQCIKNDEKRPKSLGQKIIIDLAKQYGYIPKTSTGRREPFVAYFIEDVIADISYRRSVSKNESGLTGKTLMDCIALSNDIPIKKTINLMLDDIQLGYEIVLIGLRPETCRNRTVEWIERYSIPYKELILMPNNYRFGLDSFRLESIIDHPFSAFCKRIVDTDVAANSIWKNIGIPTIGIEKDDQEL